MSKFLLNLMTNIFQKTAYSIIRQEYGGNKIMKYYNANERKTPNQFGKDLNLLLSRKKRPEQPLILLCIGTDRATGDCLGPLIGTSLIHSSPHFTVLGTLKSPIHAINLSENLFEIYHSYTEPFIIAIDACLGSNRHIGYITLSERGLKPGESIEKKLPRVGDISITGIVNQSLHSNFLVLQSTRLHTVFHLSKAICSGIQYALNTEQTSFLF